MHRAAVIVSVSAGLALGVGASVVVDSTTTSAQAGPAGEVTLAQTKATDLRAQRAIKQGTFAWNLVAKYLAEPGQRIGAREPKNIRQDAGVGGGLPTDTIADGAITSAKVADGAIVSQDVAGGAIGRQALSQEVTRALSRWIVKVNNNMGVPVTRQSSPVISMSRLATGTYLTDFGEDVSGCSWTATPSIDSGVPAAQTARTMPDPGGDPEKVLTETFNGAGFLVESGVTVQAVC